MFAEQLREMKRLNWGHLTVGRGDSVGPGLSGGDVALASFPICRVGC